MKKLFLIVTVLMLAVPALADVTISAVQAEDHNFVDINYAVSGEPNLVRGFALDISVTGGVTIEAISAEVEGESTNATPGYGIFVGSIDLTDPQTPVWGDPVAQASDPDGPGQLGSAAIVVEFGSLYDKNAVPSDAPLDSGTLCTLTLGNLPVGTFDMCIAENDLRGGIVMEDAGDPDGTVISGETGCNTELEGLPPSCACNGDADGNNRISINDLSTIVSFLSPAYAGTSPPYTCPTVPAGKECYDADGSTTISINDLSTIVSFLSPDYAGTSPPYTTPDGVCVP